MIGGLHLSPALYAIGMMTAFVLIPVALLNWGFGGNIYVDTFTNPFMAFVVIIFIGITVRREWIRVPTLGIAYIILLMIIAYIYASTFLGA